jgi:phosphatidylinositol-3,4,5-trisphosphate 3-phosphatase/dual-specificity protein phosphatase PTEN
MMISAYLVHSGLAPDAESALLHFGDTRTANGKGVTIPSQMRYVHYYDQITKRGLDAFPEHTYRVRHVRLIHVPNFDVGGGCDPYFDVRLDGKKKLFDYKKARGGKVKKAKKGDMYADMDCSDLDLRVRGDIKFVFWDHDTYSAPDKMFHFWFNTRFIHNNYLCFHKQVVDKACKDKSKAFNKDFAVEVFFEKVEDTELDAEVVDDEPPDSDDEDE